jgi:hypothetical protein
VHSKPKKLAPVYLIRRTSSSAFTRNGHYESLHFVFWYFSKLDGYLKIVGFSFTVFAISSPKSVFAHANHALVKIAELFRL